MQVAVLGMGKMGRNIAEKLMTEGHQVVVWNRSREVLETMRMEKASFIVDQKLQIVHSLEELRNNLAKPRLIWLMLPEGEPTETILQELQVGVVEPGDIIIDGGNAFYKDTQKRYT